MEINEIKSQLSQIRISLKDSFISLLSTNNNFLTCYLSINPPCSQGLSELEKMHIVCLFYQNNTICFKDDLGYTGTLMEYDVETLTDLLSQIYE